MKFLFAASDLARVQEVSTELKQAGVRCEVRDWRLPPQERVFGYSEIWVPEGPEFQFAQVLSIGFVGKRAERVGSP
jgi:hypothetical protein